MSLQWIWSDSYDISGPAGPSDKGRPHAELFNNVGKTHMTNVHIEKGFTLNGNHYFTEFYDIPPGCHAITTFTNPNPRLWTEGYTHYYLNAPLYIPVELRGGDGLWDPYGRYRNNSIIFGLEFAWAKFANGQADETNENITDWKYENIHILNPALDTTAHLPYYESVLTRYGQFSNNGVWVKYEPITGYTLMWGNLHVYNTGTERMYCGAIDLALWYEL